MGICWSCYWGWPKPVADIYNEAVAAMDGCESPMQFGPGHTVWSDENFNCADICLENFDRWKGEFSEADLAIVRKSLEKLAALPENVRDVEPEDYDDEHPALYPPPAGVEMVQV